MTGTRLALALLIGIGLAAPVAGLGEGGGLFHRKARMDPARVRQLAEIVRSEMDEKKRKAAVAELGEADPRVHPEVIPALVGALRKDASAAVRTTAADVLGRFGAVFPTAGLALEDAAESDPTAAVRDAAKQSLWEYHLIGYRSARGAGGFAGQTAEPPIARPARPGPVTSEPPVAPVVTVAAAAPPAAPLPPVGPPPGPRVAPLGPVAALLSAVPPHPNLTVEPPIARPPAAWAPPPEGSGEPPIRSYWPEPVAVGKPPPIALDLPPVVSPPGFIPGVTLFPEPTAEPPIRKPAASPGLPIPTIPVPTISLPGVR